MADTPARCAPNLSRRSLLQCLGAAFAIAPLTQVMGCSSDPVVGADAASDTGSDAASDVASDTASTVDASAADASAADASTADATATDSTTSTDGGARWITGGTRALGTTFPNPFTAAGTACTLICQTTIGPCHTTSPLRADVSDGLDGIPMRFSLRVLDEACQPLSNVIVEIWHTNHFGIYSGNINTMCNSAAADRAAMYFRGYQRTDASGIVNFNTCFPGWYSSRAVHIHVRVQTGEYAASDSAAAQVITQIVFSDELIREIFSQVSLYAAHGQPDTLLATDNVVGSITDRTPYTADIQRLSDGTMLASKTLIVKNATSTTSLCSAGGGGGSMGGPPGGDGGMPPSRDAARD